MKRIFLSVAMVLVLLLSAVLYFVWNGTISFGPSLAGMPSRTGVGDIELKTIDGCSRELDWMHQSAVKSVEKSGAMLKVVILANATCGDVYPVEPSATPRGDAIELAWSWWSPPKPIFAACKCTRHIEFSMPSVSDKTPNVVIASKNTKLE